MPVTAIVLTKDEELLLPRCLGQLTWADEVVVVDSGSTDRTREVAVEHGARVVEQPWLGWSQQRNAAAAAATHDWVVFVEADEVLDRTSREAVLAVLAGGPRPDDAYALERRDEFWGQLLPQTQRTRKSTDRVRLYQRTRSRWDERMLVHEEVVVPGAKHLLPGHLVHWRPQSVAETAERIGRYSAVEAADLVSRGRRGSPLRLVGLPVLRFLWLYLAKGSYRHGLAGYVNSVMRAHADFLRSAQHLQMQRPPAPLHPPDHLVDT